MNLNRRALITGLISFIAAPAIVRAGNLMPIHCMLEEPCVFSGTVDGELLNISQLTGKICLGTTMRIGGGQSAVIVAKISKNLFLLDHKTDPDRWGFNWENTWRSEHTP